MIHPFDEIDRAICGIPHLSPDLSDRAVGFQRAIGGRSPVSLGAALSLVRPTGLRIALFTGFVVASRLPTGETDGPLGAVGLARALARIGHRPTILADDEVCEAVRWLIGELGGSVPVRPLSEGSVALAGAFDLAIAIEKPGENDRGVLHTSDGFRIDAGSRSVDLLFSRIGERGPTIAIGDGGNEVGFGRISEYVKREVPFGGKCRCGCGGGIAAATPAEHLVPAAVSNWGAYGIAAALAVLRNDGTLCVRPHEEERMLHVAAVRGVRDGIRRECTFGVDGLSGRDSIAVVERLTSLVARAIKGHKKRACA